MTKTHGRRQSLGILGLLLPSMLFVCPCAFALNPALDASQYAHTQWKIRDGFTKGEIRSITQTLDGYLWLGTEFGLLRFDGVRAVPWQPPPGQHLPSNNILSLLAARDGTLWIGTYEGLASWKGGKFIQYAELAGLYVFNLLEDHEGTVWATGLAAPTGKLCAIHNGSVQCYGEDGALGRGAFQLYEDSKGNLWAGVKTGLWRWKPGPPKFYPLPGEPDGIQGLGQDVDGALLVGWNGGIHRFVDGKTEAYPLPGSMQPFRTKRLVRDRDGGLWIGTGDRGIVHVHKGKADVFSSFEGLSGDDVYSLFEDREGSIWVSTISGLDRFRDFAVATLSVKQGLLNARIGSVLADRDGSIVWLGTYGGLNRWNDSHVRASPLRGYKLGRKPDNLPESLFQDGSGRIWVSTVQGVGYLENDRFIPVRGIPGGNLLAMVRDAAENLWVVNEQLGLFQLEKEGKVQQIPWTRLGHQDHASAIIADPMKGGLWLGFHYGGVTYFEDGQVRASYTATNGLGEGRVNALEFDRDGALWVATDGGLSRLKNGGLGTLTSKAGLPCDAVHWVMEDDNHSFWLEMACGLVRIARSELDAWAAAVDKDKHTKIQVQATVFDSSDGVRSNADGDHYSPQVAKTSDGRIWFLPFDGVSVVDPRHLAINKLPPSVHIEQITADRKTYDPVSYANGNMPLPARVRDLTIDYTALSLVAPERVRFRYKLEGRDSDWQDAGNRRQAFYTDLPPRNYRFRVMACNNSGVWNEAGAFLDFSVAPAYYQTVWFRSSLVAAFFALLVGLYRLRLRQLAQEFDMRAEERVRERTRIARELHDSLLQGFQGLMFRLQAVRDMLPGRASAEAIEALDIALERGDRAIAEGRDTVSDLREPIMGDSDIAQALTALGEELATQSDNGATPCVRVLVEGKQRELNPMLRDEIYRIGREALRNAFRHARAQKIEAEITYGDSEFSFYVRDDGIGLAPAVANQGSRVGHWGLPGMRERAKSFGGKLEVWSEDGAGTEIELSVPAPVAYGGTRAGWGAGWGARRRFWSLRKKIGVTDGKYT